MTTVPERKRKRKVSGKRHVAVRPIIDKTTTYDTFTREELMRFREEEAERFRNGKTKPSKN